MGTSCSCKSMFSVGQSEITRHVTLSPKSEKTEKDNSSIQISENTDKHFVLQQYPDRYIIIYTSNENNYEIFMQELLEINDNSSFVIQECKDQNENSNIYQEFSSQMQCSLNDFRL